MTEGDTSGGGGEETTKSGKGEKEQRRSIAKALHKATVLLVLVRLFVWFCPFR